MQYSVARAQMSTPTEHTPGASRVGTEGGGALQAAAAPIQPLVRAFSTGRG
jgi:hypothetical protein